MGFLAGLVPSAIGVVGSVLGGKGNDFQAPGAAIAQPVNQQQAQDALAQQQAFVQALNSGQGLTGGAANLQNTFANLGNVAAGQGPNPAQALLANTTGNNIAQQAALMAGQRGASQNAGLLARQAGVAGGNLQQQAAGQAAALQAQQALNALGMQGQLAGQQAGMQQQAIQGLTADTLGQINAQNQANIQNAANMAGINANVAAQNTQNNRNLWGGITNAAGGALGALGLGSNSAPAASAASAPSTSNNAFGFDAKKALAFADGGEVGPMSHYGRSLYNQGGMAANSANQQGVLKENYVHGKAKVKGDSSKNDTVPAILSPGEIVIPRSVAQSKNAPEQAAKFVAAILAKKGKLK